MVSGLVNAWQGAMEAGKIDAQKTLHGEGPGVRCF